MDKPGPMPKGIQKTFQNRVALRAEILDDIRTDPNNFFVARVQKGKHDLRFDVQARAVWNRICGKRDAAKRLKPSPELRACRRVNQMKSNPRTVFDKAQYQQLDRRFERLSI